MLADFTRAATDPERLALGAELAVVDARLDDLFRRVDTGESGALWKRLQTAYRTFLDARRTEDRPAMALALTELGDLITRGAADSAIWSEVVGLIAERRKLAESERKRLVELQNVLTTEQAMVFVANLTASVKKHVKDRDALIAIADDLRRATALPGR
jgi:hypothetical protein